MNQWIWRVGCIQPKASTDIRYPWMGRPLPSRRSAEQEAGTQAGKPVVMVKEVAATEWALLSTDPKPGTLLSTFHVFSPLFLGQPWEVATIIPSLQMKKLRAGSHRGLPGRIRRVRIQKDWPVPVKEELTWGGRVFKQLHFHSGFQSGGRAFAAPHSAAQTPEARLP